MATQEDFTIAFRKSTRAYERAKQEIARLVSLFPDPACPICEKIVDEKALAVITDIQYAVYQLGANLNTLPELRKRVERKVGIHRSKEHDL